VKAAAKLLLGIFFISCASGLPTTPNEREWSALSAEYQKLEILRQSAGSMPGDASRKQRIESLLESHKRMEPVFEPFVASLREYYERTGDLRAAQLYAREKIRLGDDYMNVLARYDRAIGMYQAALALEPTSMEAKERLQKAERLRFVSMETFSTIQTGMKEGEIQKLIGTPREDWIKQVIQNNRVYTVWIYPRNDGGASAVYFDNGVVYHTNWNAAAARKESR